MSEDNKTGVRRVRKKVSSGAKEGEVIPAKKKASSRPAGKSVAKLNKSTEVMPATDEVDMMDKALDKIIAERPQIKEDEQFQMYYQMFKNIRKLAKKAYKNALDKPTARNIYPLLQIYNQMREIIADIRALKNVSELTDCINQEVLQPYAQQSSATFIEYYHNVVGLIQRDAPPATAKKMVDELKRHTKATGVSLLASYENSIILTNQVLSEQ